MNKRSLLYWLPVLLVLFIAAPDPVYAWGPAVHFYLGSQFLQLGLAGVTLAKLLRRHSQAFLYGNVVADIVTAKSRLDFENSPHNWQMLDILEANSTSDEQRAFIAGYRMHLAADTVAHNIFVPDHSKRLRLPENSAHTYWELRADERVPVDFRRKLNSLKHWPTDEIDILLEKSTPETVLPFSWNWKIFNSILSFSSSKNWHKFSGIWGKYSRHDLCEETLDEYWQLSLERMRHSVGKSHQRRQIVALDPTGQSVAV